MFTKSAYRLPAEWEPQSGVQLTWPHADTDWAPVLNDIIKTYHQMAREISKRERLIIVAPQDAARDMVRFVCPTDDTWARDHGFLTLTDDMGHHRLLDYCFNGWGEKFPSMHDNAISRHIVSAGLFASPLVSHDDFVLEGGSVESDGNGTVFTTSQCLLAPHRNQPLTEAEIEADKGTPHEEVMREWRAEL
jgi:agmatine/peptidylarginine deiminase